MITDHPATTAAQAGATCRPGHSAGENNTYLLQPADNADHEEKNKQKRTHWRLRNHPTTSQLCDAPPSAPLTP